MISILFNYGNVGLLVLRLALGVIFLAHALSKLKDLKANAQGFEGMGFKPGGFWGTLVAIAETLGSLSVLFGFYTQWGALVLAVVMVVSTLWKISHKQGLIGGFELDLILLASALLLTTVPLGGIYSLDYYLFAQYLY